MISFLYGIGPVNNVQCTITLEVLSVDEGCLLEGVHRALFQKCQNALYLSCTGALKQHALLSCGLYVCFCLFADWLAVECNHAESDKLSYNFSSWTVGV